MLAKRNSSRHREKNVINLTGKSFGNLIVLNQEPSKKTPNGSTKSMWKCQCSCGNITIVAGQSLKNGNTKSGGCIKSQGEEKISKILNNNHIPFQREYIFPDFFPYRFDFFIENKYIIEYDGKQHFEDYSWGSSQRSKEMSQQRDALKNAYCFEHSIPIIRIPYTHFENLNIKDLILETTSFQVIS